MTRKKASKSKANTATASKNLPQGNAVPEGMSALGGGYADTWSPEVGDSIRGPITGAVKEVEMTIGRRKQTRRCLELTDAESGNRFTIWESAALGDFFDVAAEHGEGGDWFIRFDGLGKARKAGQNPPKLFTVAQAA